MDTVNPWSGQMVSLLCRINRERKTLIGLGAEAEYQELIGRGREENKRTTHRYARKDEITLLNRKEKYGHNHLLFLHDFTVSFDDNMSVRELRKAKNRQKMTRGFRKDSGHEMYCAILSIVETLKRRNMTMLENIRFLQDNYI